MNYPNVDPARLREIEKTCGVKCLNPAPFKPTELVEWACDTRGHKWMASYIEIQIDNGCFRCNPGDMKRGNGNFSLAMSHTMAKLAADFKNGKSRLVGYSPDAVLHISIAGFFFNAVRTEFILKALSAEHATLGLGKKMGLFRKHKTFNSVELVNRMYDSASKNLNKFKISCITPSEAQNRYEKLKDEIIKYIVARNKIAHGHSKYPISKRGNYNHDIANFIKSFGKKEPDIYSKSTKFLDISERLLDISNKGISYGNKILWDLFLGC